MLMRRMWLSRVDVLSKGFWLKVILYNTYGGNCMTARRNIIQIFDFFQQSINKYFVNSLALHDNKEICEISTSSKLGPLSRLGC